MREEDADYLAWVCKIRALLAQRDLKTLDKCLDTEEKRVRLVMQAKGKQK